MGIKEDLRRDIDEVKVKLDEVKGNSWAMELIHEYKLSNRVAMISNRRMFIIIIVLMFMFVGLLGYTIYLLNDISQVTTTDIQQDAQDGGNNNYIGNDGDIVYGETKNKNK